MMNKSTSKKTLLLATMSLGAAVSTQGNIISLFENAGDLASNFNSVTNSTSSDTIEVNPSSLTGVAIRQFDTDGAGRTTLRYTPASAFNDGIQVSFDIADFSTSNANVFRIGPDGANLAGGANAALAVRIGAGGTITAETGAGLVNWAGAFTTGTPFNLSVVYNTRGTNLTVGGGGPTLLPNEWAIFLNGSILDDGSNSSTNLTDLTASGAQDIWWLTGTASGADGSDIFYDNILISTGSDITVVPEPSVTALATGVLFMGLVMFRRFRKGSR